YRADRILRTDLMPGARHATPEDAADQLGRRRQHRRDGNHGHLDAAARGEGNPPVPRARRVRPRRPHAAARTKVYERRVAQPRPASSLSSAAATELIDPSLTTI